MEEIKLESVRDNNVELVQDILKELTPLTERSKAADELARILKEPHFQVRLTFGPRVLRLLSETDTMLGCHFHPF